ncbi:MAG: D-cysteine desulfhydrase family protein [Ignavibacteriales bacterium]|jgi:1-aminocyclopropane-1-carboxylate deaminase|nr:MAG: D-cysteine desulfhydrase family protein [Ignavibacteriaceae bacterium]MBW7874139.1 D-cysteine desulfhydrase family protein [Ignavibacteria bacterium]MCZ2142914.1 D-cysteine desulfhydrase family protein [Ignavibacteriales bacterium]OQY78304.1 MAG: hypothetical protein B6D45_02185 [Ignavibacteriales bacterium UTCHB3]MBV6444532.1 D-cysteine desulfhydrase [Ignavibacteriaceae bacterium]
MFEKIERLHFANLPTPIETADRLAQHLGLKQILIKRDDLTGLALGGNKARKLEFELAQVVKMGYDTIVTVGGQQSNHARMTAAAARKLGLEVVLVLGGKDFNEFKGNLLLDVFFGAEIHYINGSDEDEDLETLQFAVCEELKKEGKNPYALPLGGSTPHGTLGYVKAMEELAGQLHDDKVHIFTPVGSCGTLAGCVLGASLFLPNAEVTGISVSRTVADITRRTKVLAAQTAALLGLEPAFADVKFTVYDCYHEEYAKHIKIAMDAAETCARLEGMILDQVYTGKAMAGLFDLAKREVLRKDSTVLFIHTGGMPEIFADTINIPDYPKCTKYTPDAVRKMKR